MKTNLQVKWKALLFWSASVTPPMYLSQPGSCRHVNDSLCISFMVKCMNFPHILNSQICVASHTVVKGREDLLESGLAHLLIASQTCLNRAHYVIGNHPMPILFNTSYFFLTFHIALEGLAYNSCIIFFFCWPLIDIDCGSRWSSIKHYSILGKKYYRKVTSQ